MEEQPTVTPTQEQQREVIEVLERLEDKLESKLEMVAKSFITWKAMALMVIPLMAGTAWGMVQYHAREADERLQSAVELQARAVKQVEGEVNKLNEKLGAFNDNVDEHSQAIERLSTAIEFMGRQIQEMNERTR